ncbi:hypothetical protein [Streptomyces malaysiense]|uniref:hypothetical protein n=1 Tax=Streptomyces malaysiense TaxID=1428626 RepID=UPI000A6E767F|nr:hypothetical protein [Streptomyces malaysiense]
MPKVKAAAPSFQQGAIDLGEALTTLIKTLDGLGEPWRHDKQGNQFGGVCKPHQTSVESAAGVLVLGLTTFTRPWWTCRTVTWTTTSSSRHVH